MDNSNCRLHFILCMERTGSSMLTAMLNRSSFILSPSEEPFALYFHRKYKNKTEWSENDIAELLDEFRLTAEKNLDLFFSPFDTAKRNIVARKNEINNYSSLCKLIYLQFFPLKDKSGINTIIDKQIKYILCPEKIAALFPESKFIVLCRDYRDVMVSWKKRKLHGSAPAAYISKAWEISYSRVFEFTRKNAGKVLLTRYEDLVESPEKTLKEICRFLDIEFMPQMTEHNENLQSYIENMQKKTGRDFIDRFREFHSNTLKPVTNELSGAWKNSADNRDVTIAEKICGVRGKTAGYEVSIVNAKTRFSFSDRFYILKAAWHYNVVLKLYMNLPLWLKKALKKIRPNRIDE